MEPTVTDLGGLRATSFWDDIEKNLERTSVAISGRFGGHLHPFPIPASKHSGWHLFPRAPRFLTPESSYPSCPCGENLRAAMLGRRTWCPVLNPQGPHCPSKTHEHQLNISSFQRRIWLNFRTARAALEKARLRESLPRQGGCERLSALLASVLAEVLPTHVFWHNVTRCQKLLLRRQRWLVKMSRTRTAVGFELPTVLLHKRAMISGEMLQMTDIESGIERLVQKTVEDAR